MKKNDTEENSQPIQSNESYKLRVSLYDRTLMGFWGRKTLNGFSMGPFIPKGANPYHLTFFTRDNVVNVHFTEGKKPNVRHTNLLNISHPELELKLQTIGSAFENSIHKVKMKSNTKVLYFGNAIIDFMNGVSTPLTISNRSSRRVTYNIQVERLATILSRLINKMGNDLEPFFGMTNFYELKKDQSIAGGISKKGELIFMCDDQAFGMRIPLTQIRANNSFNLFNSFPPLAELFQLFGINQLLTEICNRGTCSSII